MRIHAPRGRRLKATFALFTASALLAGVGPSSSAAQTSSPPRFRAFALRLLSPYERLPGFGANAINDFDDVVGFLQISEGNLGWVWSRGRYRFLNGQLGARFVGITSINDRGDLVGGMTLPGGSVRTFVIRGSNLRILTNPYQLSDINNHREAVGIGNFGDGNEHAAMWFRGRIIDLGEGSAAAVNDHGVAVGETHSIAALFHNGRVRTLGTLGGCNSTASDINNAGEIVGWSATAPACGFDHAFLWRKGRMTDLGGPPEGGYGYTHATAVNDLGTVVGLWETGYGAGGFLWTNGTMYDLQHLLVPGSGWTLYGAIGINAMGDILVEGERSGRWSILILKPVAVSQ